MKVLNGVKVGFMVTNMEVVTSIIEDVHALWLKDGIKIKAYGLTASSLVRDAFLIAFLATEELSLDNIASYSEKGHRHIVRVHRYIDNEVTAFAENYGIWKAAVYQSLCTKGLNILQYNSDLYAVLTAGSCFGLKGIGSVEAFVKHAKNISLFLS